MTRCYLLPIFQTILLVVLPIQGRILLSKEKSANNVRLDLPARYMWGWEPGRSGFCGSMTIQTTNLYYGNYISQGLVRASHGNKELNSFEDIEYAMTKLKMVFESWDYKKEKAPQHKAFWKWVKSHLKNGRPLVGTAYEKMRGDYSNFDHIIPYVGYYSENGLEYSENDKIYYNDLFFTFTRENTLKDFIKTAKECHTEKAQNREWCMPKDVNYASAIFGFKGMAETVKAKLSVGRIDEPDWSEEDKQNQKPVPLTGTLSMSGMQKGQSYSIYRFSGKDGPDSKSIDLTNLPDKDFDQSQTYDFKYDYVADADEGIFVDPNMFMSNTAQFYRVVSSKKLIAETF